MINFSNLNIKRAIMHQILGRTNCNETAYCEFSDELLNTNAETAVFLKQQLMTALGISDDVLGS